MKKREREGGRYRRGDLKRKPPEAEARDFASQTMMMIGEEKCRGRKGERFFMVAEEEEEEEEEEGDTINFAFDR